MKWNVKGDYHVELEDVIDEALVDAFLDPSQSEPQLIANLVWYLPRYLNSIKPRSGVSIQSSGVFVHGQPFVKCTPFPNPTPQSVEIGDLLLLRTGLVNGRVSEQRALLLQAKKFQDPHKTPDNPNQHHLYDVWPTFEYVRSTPALNGKKRHITGNDVHLGTKYLLIRDYAGCKVDCPSPDCMYPTCAGDCLSLMTAHPTNPKLSHYRDFRNELLEFILGNAGKEYVSPPPKRTRNWDKVIEDLTTISAERVSLWMRRASSGTSSTRGQQLSRIQRGQMHFSTGISSRHSQLAHVGFPRQGEWYDEPPSVPPIEFDNEEYKDGGVSIIEFVVNSEELWHE